MVYKLYGLRTELYYNTFESTEFHDIRDLVATFGSQEEAERYVQNSLLLNSKSRYFRCNLLSGNFRFKSKSLLRNYEDYEIVENEAPIRCPHNPIL